MNKITRFHINCGDKLVIIYSVVLNISSVEFIYDKI